MTLGEVFDLAVRTAIAGAVLFVVAFLLGLAFVSSREESE